MSSEPDLLEPLHQPAADLGEASASDRFAGVSRIPVWLAGPLVIIPLAMWVLTSRGSFWFDEAVSLAATKNLAETFAETSGTMGLYYLALTPWSWINDSAAWLRAPSVIFMTTACGLFGALMGRQHGANLGKLAGVIAAISALPLWYATEARSYGMLALVVVMAWYSLERAMGDPDERWLWLFVVCATLTPFIHGLGIVQVAVQVGAVILARPGAAVMVKVLVGAFCSAVAAGFLLLLGINDVAQWVPPLTAGAALDFATTLIHPDGFFAVVLLLVVLAGIAHLHGMPASTTISRFRRVTLLIWGPGTMILIVVLSTVRPAQIPRYGLPAAFALAGLLALGIVALSKRYSPHLTVGFIAILAITTLVAVDRMQDEPWHDAITVISERSEPGDQIVFGTAVSRITFEAAWTHNDGPPLGIVGPGRELGSYDRFGDRATAAELESAISGESNLWLVDQPRRSHPSRGHELIESLSASGWTTVGRWNPGAGISVVLLSRPAQS